MDDTMKNTATEELVNNTAETEDTIEEVVKEEMQKIQRQNLLLGAQTMCRVILDKIITFKTKPGKPTMNDYKRLVKDIESFCTTGLSRKVTADGETVPRDEEPAADDTVQN